jgi:hydroxypyruvate isomerase
VNVHTLFSEAPLLDRFGLAAEAGFEAVESWWPENTDLDAYAGAIAAAGVELVLLNFTAGRFAQRDRGVLSDVARSHEFRENVPIALELAARLGCRQLNALVGIARPDQLPSRQLRLAAENVRWAADHAAVHGAYVLVEPLNRFDNGPCLIQSVESALRLIREVDRPNVGLQFDTYHVMRTEAVVDTLIEHAAASIRHVQIADAPGRGQPGTGGIDFPAVFAALRRVGYDRYVGLEYFADSSLEDSFKWLPPRFRRGAHDIDDVMDVLVRLG